MKNVEEFRVHADEERHQTKYFRLGPRMRNSGCVVSLLVVNVV